MDTAVDKIGNGQVHPLLEEFPKEKPWGMQDEVHLSLYTPGRVTLSLALPVIIEEEFKQRLCRHSASIRGEDINSLLPETP